MFRLLITGSDSQKLPDDHGSTLFQFFFNPDAVPMEHLTPEAVQVCLLITGMSSTKVAFSVFFR